MKKKTNVRISEMSGWTWLLVFASSQPPEVEEITPEHISWLEELAAQSVGMSWHG